MSWNFVSFCVEPRVPAHHWASDGLSAIFWSRICCVWVRLCERLGSAT